jgi:hypothetical protein
MIEVLKRRESQNTRKSENDLRMISLISVDTETPASGVQASTKFNELLDVSTLINLF